MPSNDISEPFTKALLYYIEHIQLDLRYSRCDLLRHTIDPICALMNGFITKKHNGNFEGNHEKYKKNYYITREADKEKEKLAEEIAVVKAKKITESEKKEEINNLNKKYQLHMEHVIPIKAIEHELISKKDDFIQPEHRRKLLVRLMELSKPCLVTMREKKLLDTKELKCTKDYLATPWERYVKAGVCLPIEENKEIPSNITSVNPSLPKSYLEIESLPDTLE